jgi:hypothetical protein
MKEFCQPGRKAMQSVISGRLVGIEETAIRIRLRTGEVKVYPRKEFDISLQWAIENLGQPVICLLRDGVVGEVKSLGPGPQPGLKDTT